MEKFLDDHALLTREPDPKALHLAHALLSSNPEAGLAELESLANRGSVMALLYLANEWKLKGKDKFPIAQKWYRRAYDKMSATALLNLALTYSDQGNYDEAEALWKSGVAKGDGPSMFWLANLYLSNARYVEKKGQAIDLLEKASALGQIRAKHHLALILMKERYSIRGVMRGISLYVQTIAQGIRIAYRDPTSRRLW